MDYLGAQSNSLAFCLSVETAARHRGRDSRAGRLDPRAHRRAAAHQQPPGLAGHARHGSRRHVGDAVLLPRAGAAPQHQRDAGRASGCSRATSGSAGCARTCRADSTRRSRTFLDTFPGKIDEYEKLLTKNQIWIKRTKGVGRLSKEDTLAMGLVGPMARAVGIPYDVRKVFPYLHYETFDFDRADGDRRRRVRPLHGQGRGDAAERADLRSRRSSASRRPGSSTAATTASCRRPRIACTRRWRR